MIVDGWKERLERAVAESGRSRSEISVAAVKSRTYLHGVLQEGKEPTVARLLKVCEAIPADPIYILFGIEAKPGDIAILRGLHESPELRAAILTLIAQSKKP